MFCTKCGMNLQEEWKICPTCGAVVYKLGNKPCKGESERSISVELNAGEMTISGKRRFSTEVLIQGNMVTINSFMNTKNYSEPITNKFMIQNIKQIKYSFCAAMRNIHKIRFIASGVLLVLGLLSGMFYFSIIALIVAGVNYYESLWRGMKIFIDDGRKVTIFYDDKDDAIQIEKELKTVSS